MTPIPAARCGVVLGCAASMVTLVACGSVSPSTSSAGASPTPVIDTCLVGSWVTSDVSGTQPDSGARVTGGAGQVVIIKPDGAVSIDPTGSQPIQLVLEGQTYTVTQTGIGSGTITTHGGQLELRIAAGASLNTVVSQNGTPIGTPSAETGFTASYSCTAGRSLSIDENGISYSFIPRGGATTPTTSASPGPG